MYLPDDWIGKKVAVVLAEGGRRVQTKLVSDSAGGIVVEGDTLDNDIMRTSFIPWTSVRYVHLLD
jgi:hypothetical protein